MWNPQHREVCIEKSVLYSIASQLRDLLSGDKEVVFSGGEPLLYDGIAEIVALYSREGLKVGMASNGVMIDRQIADDIVKAGLRNIQLSLDSCVRQTHDFLRGVQGAYDRLLKGAECLLVYKSSLSVCAQTVISESNINEIADTVEFVARDNRFDLISFMAITDPFFSQANDTWREKGKFSYLWPKSKKQIDRAIDDLIKMKQSGYPIANPVSHLELFRYYFHNPYDRKPETMCCLGDYVINIDPACDVRLCCFMDPIGSIKQKTLTDILGSEDIVKIRSAMKNCEKTCNTLVNCFFK